MIIYLHGYSFFCLFIYHLSINSSFTYVSIKKNIIAIIRIASNLVLKILLKKGSNMTIVIPVFHVIISFSIVFSVVE